MTRREALAQARHRLVARVLRLVSPADSLRRVVAIAAVLVAAWSGSVAALYSDASSAPLFAAVAAVAAVVAWLRPSTRPVLLPALAAWLTLGSADDGLLGPAAGAVMTLAMLADTDDPPWRPWAAGVSAAVVSLLLFFETPLAPFLSVAIGGLLGLLVRSLTRADRLAGETDELRTQTVWLEQRTALARELHDVVGHHVTAMVVQAEAGLVGDPERALREVAGLGRAALGELDSLVVHLRDPDAVLTVQAPPRLADVDELLAAPLRAQGVQVEVTVQPDLVLDEVQVLGVYRIVQESLTNVARHAGAHHASVEVVEVQGHLRIRVSDDGVGAPDEPDRGSGLLGIDERVRALGGFWELGRRLGGGTVVDVVLPLPGHP